MADSFPKPDPEAAARILAERLRHQAQKADAKAAAKPAASFLSGLFETRPGSCADHGDFTEKRLRRPGVNWAGCPECARLLGLAREQLQAVAAAAERAKAAAERAQEAMGLAAIPPALRDRTFAGYVATTPKQRTALTTCRSFSEDFDQHHHDGTGLILAGSTGTGKGHLAACIQLALLGRYRTQYITASELVRAVRETWRTGASMSQTELFSHFGKALDLLVIDEIGQQYGTDGERQVIAEIIDLRYRELRPTIVCGNVSQQSLLELVGDRVFDRMIERSKWVGMTWDSYRLTARKGGL